jgi:hypothetical protein
MARLCRNCNTNFEAKFCHNCGQKAFTADDTSIKSIFKELVHFFTNLESNLLLTLKTIIVSPGKLTLDYCSGIRKKYYKPLSLFLLIVVIYLLFPIAKGLNMEMTNYKSNFIGRGLIKAQIEDKMASKNISEAELAAEFKVKSSTTSKILLFLLIPLTALLLLAFFPGRQNKIYDISILSIELNIFYIAVIFLILPLVVYASAFVFKLSQIKDDVLFPFLFGIFGFYIFALLRKFYQPKWPWLIVKSVFVTFFYLILIQTIYKFVVFEVTILLL